MLHRFEMAKMSVSSLLVAVLIFAIPFVGFTEMVNTTFDMRTAKFDLIIIPATLLGFAVSFLAAKLCMVWNGARNVLAAIGRRSLYLFAWELPIAYVLSRTTNGFIPHPTNGFQHSWILIGGLRMVLALVLAYAASYPAMWLLDKLRGRRCGYPSRVR